MRTAIPQAILRAATLMAFVLAPMPVLAQQSLVASNDTRDSAGSQPPLRPGDEIQVSSLSEPQLQGTYEVTPQGTVDLPLLGEWSVTGVPGDVLRKRLDASYGDKFRQRNAVEVMLKRRVRILGAVQKPGLYYVDRTMTLGDAVALAGGASANGDWKNVKILRQGRQIHAHLDAATQVSQEVYSGDEIILPEKGWFSRNGAVLIGAGASALAIVIAQLLLRH